MTIGSNIKASRIRAGMSAVALAERVGVTRQAVYSWEADESVPVSANIADIAVALNVTSDYILGLNQ